MHVYFDFHLAALDDLGLRVVCVDLDLYVVVDVGRVLLLRNRWLVLQIIPNVLNQSLFGVIFDHAVGLLL